MVRMRAQRHTRLLKYVQQHGTAHFEELATLLDVSTATVRRDLNTLDGRGLLTRVHGGARALGGGIARDPNAVKIPTPATESIGRAAAALVQPGSAIGIAAGPTTRIFARHLAHVKQLTVVTNSPTIANELQASPGPTKTIVLTGGVLSRSDTLTGPIAQQSIRDLHLDSVYLGVHGMAVTAGLTSTDMLEAETHRALAASTGRLVVLAEHTTWNVAGLARIGPLSAASVVVSDENLPGTARRELSQHVENLIVARDAGGSA